MSPVTIYYFQNICHMPIKINLETGNKAPIYKQIVEQFDDSIRSGQLQPGELVPSMNEFAAQLGISKETVKKIYGILRDRGLLTPRQGKGFYVAEQNESRRRILVIFDKLSIYKEVLYNSFVEELGDSYEITILTHNQNLELFNYYLDTYLDKFDYYVISPHFPLDEKSQSTAVKLLTRIPNRKLIMVDHWIKELPGNYSAIYQDFENDIYNGLNQGLDKLKKTSVLKIIILHSSLYGHVISKGVERFCLDNEIPYELISKTPDEIHPNETFIVLGSQLDSGLTALARKIKASNLEVGKDVFIISYNEFDLCEVIMNGLTTVSADFKQMGQTAAKVILNQKTWKVHCNFSMIHRSTF